MNVDTIPQIVWDELAVLAIVTGYPKDVQQQRSFCAQLDHKFYRGLYVTASSSGGKYVKRTEEKSVWQQFVSFFWTSNQKPLSEVLAPPKLPKSINPKSVLNKGTAVLQIDNKAAPNEADVKMARVYESYNSRTLAARFQFVVHSGGGIVLFNRMRRACQEYIHALGDNPEHSAASAWKVFGEEGQIGRSDSCVTYLAERFESDAVTALIAYVWQNTKDLIDAEFEAMGMTKVDGKAIWGFNIPDERLEMSVLGERSQGSAGGLMAVVLKNAYLAAMLELGADGKTVEKKPLADKAKANSRALVARLYP
jgi:hypothetical protein